MTPVFYSEPSADIYRGDAIEVMASLPADNVDMVCSSPPYWGLRVYKGEQQRLWADGTTAAFGLEKSPELYVTHSLEVLQAIRRVLKPWGVCFWNIGDSYWGGKGQSGYELPHEAEIRREKGETLQTAHNVPGYMSMRPSDGKHPPLKPLDLCLIPERVALAAQEDGWFVRSIVVWQKPNPMPESVSGWRWEQHRVKVKGRDARKQRAGVEATEQLGNSWPDNKGGVFQQMAEYVDCPGCDKCSPNDGLVLRKGSWRPTDAYEHILMLAKSHEYYGDGEDVREAQQKESLLRATRGWDGDTKRGYPNGPQSHIDRYFNKSLEEALALPGRNLRNVWTFPTASFKESHFAVFPEELPRRCILSSTSAKGNCPKCGKPWARVIEKKSSTMNIRVRDAKRGVADPEEGYKATEVEIANYGKEKMGESQTLGWSPSCSCNAGEPVPAVVLDCFAGSGTSGVVAKQLGRHAILIDISEDYCKMARKRIETTPAPMRLEC